MSSRTIEGYAAVFFDPSNPSGTQYQLDENLYERISPTAFNRTLRNGDIVAGFNHELDHILGRKSAGTLSLDVDSRGLKYRIRLSTSGIAEHVRQAVARGDLRGASIAFVVLEQRLERQQVGRESVVIRTLEDVELYEVGPVVIPAYRGTTSELVA